MPRSEYDAMPKGKEMNFLNSFFRLMGDMSPEIMDMVRLKGVEGTY